MTDTSGDSLPTVIVAAAGFVLLLWGSERYQPPESGGAGWRR